MHTRILATALLFSVTLPSTSGCIRANSVTIGRKTDLERQLIGRLEPLSDEELLAVSVRAEPVGIADSIRELENRAISARRRQLFNRDDLRRLASAGCVGESTNGLITIRPCDGDLLFSERSRLVKEENTDRQAIIDWAIDADPSLTRGDEDQVRAVYHTLAVEQAPPGAPIERPDGTWNPRE